jgi:hypothetical protein
MDHLQIFNMFGPLFADPLKGGSFPAKRPLLAHYTSIRHAQQETTDASTYSDNSTLRH